MNSYFLFVVILLLAGVLFLGISSAMLRSLEKAERAPGWPALVDESLAGADAQTRREIVERLAIVGTAWSRDVLTRAAEDEKDEGIRSAIRSALATASYESTSP